jgi:tetratricopeptide (TPR) repeat protein
MSKGWAIGLLAGLLLGGAGGYLLRGRGGAPRDTELAEAVQLLGLPGRARERWKELHERNPDDPVARAGLALAHFREGQSLGDRNDWTGAIRAFGEAVRLEPGVHYFHLGLGNAYMSENRYEQGLAEFDEARRLEPKSIGANMRAFHVRLQLGKPDEAKVDLERLEELAREKRDLAAALPRLYELLALAFEESGAAEEAKAAREKAEALRGG